MSFLSAFIITDLMQVYNDEVGKTPHDRFASYQLWRDFSSE